MKKRWISLHVENEPGVLARICGLFSGKSYNLDSLTVGPTEDETVSRMTIGLTGDDRTFEQIKKQLARSVEVIKVVDLTETAMYCRELMFVRIHDCSRDDISQLFEMAAVFHAAVIDYSPSSVLLKSVQTEEDNSLLLKRLKLRFLNRVYAVRGGSVAIAAISAADWR